MSNESIKFSIVNVKSDFALVNKSLDIDFTESLTTNGANKSELKQISRRDISNGKLDNQRRRNGNNIDKPYSEDRRARKKTKISLLIIKSLIVIKSGILQLELNIHRQELSLEISCQTFLIQE